MNSTTFDRVARIASDILDLPVSRIGPTTSPQTVETWDSIQHLNLVLALEQDLGVQFDPDDIEKMQDIGQIVAIADAKLGG